ncbi:hypothetical protein LCGC14_2420980, partial [marine sediment metagenome]
MKFNLPKDHRPYIDKYFLRAKTILEKDGLNPIVKAQVFIRKGDCKVYGLNEAIAILNKYNPNPKNMTICSLQEGDSFIGGEVLMTIKAPIQDIIDLETMYLGVLSAETTLKNGGKDIDIFKINQNMLKITTLVGDRPVSYFGARHWRYDRDRDIASACCLGGSKNCSTDEGAKGFGQKEGIGTIPHALETIYHWTFGLNKAVEEAAAVFEIYIDEKKEAKMTLANLHIKEKIPVIALVDYANREILDSLAVAPIVDGIRIDTCGENYMQGVMPGNDEKFCIWEGGCRDGFDYVFNPGVSLYGVYLVRKLLNDSGFVNVKIILSSGFGNPDKVKVFIEAEKILGMKLFDGLGVGGVYESRMATMDIIE